jgi:hypothetical protein
MGYIGLPFPDQFKGRDITAKWNTVAAVGEHYYFPAGRLHSFPDRVALSPVRGIIQ